MHSKSTDILTRTRRVPPLGEDQIMEAIAAGDRSPLEIALASGVSILELARIVTTPDNLRQLQQVAQLHAIEREMLMGRLKRKALLRLAELTDEVAASSADEIRASEVMRKACADLLHNWESGSRTRSNPSGPGGPGGSGGGRPRGYPGGGYQPEPLTPAFEAEVLEALERLGAEEKECPQIEDSPRRITQTKWEDNENEYGYEPRAPGKPQGPPRRASGSVPPESPPPPDTTTPSEKRSPPEIQSSFISQPGEEPRRSGQTGAYASGSLSDNPDRIPLPLYIKSTQNRIMNNSTRTLHEDAHPP